MSKTHRAANTLPDQQALSITDLSIQFGGLKAVEGLSFYV